MEVVEAEFEILRIPEAVSLPFEGFDLVYESFHSPRGNAMLEVAEKFSPVCSKCLTDPYECLASGSDGVFAPYGEELLSFFAIILFPE